MGSPLGKFPLDGDFSTQLDGLKRALDYAAILQAPYIRMFSFYIPQGYHPADFRPRVMDWLGRMIAEAEKTDIILAHENEKGIYGDTAARCLDLFSTLQSPNFAGVFDFANFVQCDQSPYTDCWPVLRPYIRYFHIKDAVRATGQITPVGQGNGDVAQILKEALDAGFDDFLTLEPHLSLAEANYGRTSPELFATAANALKAILPV